MAYGGGAPGAATPDPMAGAQGPSGYNTGGVGTGNGALDAYSLVSDAVNHAAMLHQRDQASVNAAFNGYLNMGFDAGTAARFAARDHGVEDVSHLLNGVDPGTVTGKQQNASDAITQRENASQNRLTGQQGANDARNNTGVLGLLRGVITGGQVTDSNQLMMLVKLVQAMEKGSAGGGTDASAAGAPSPGQASGPPVQPGNAGEAMPSGLPSIPSMLPSAAPGTDQPAPTPPAAGSASATAPPPAENPSLMFSPSNSVKARQIGADASLTNNRSTVAGRTEAAQIGAAGRLGSSAESQGMGGQSAAMLFQHILDMLQGKPSSLSLDGSDITPAQVTKRQGITTNVGIQKGHDTSREKAAGIAASAGIGRTKITADTSRANELTRAGTSVKVAGMRLPGAGKMDPVNKARYDEANRLQRDIDSAKPHMITDKTGPHSIIPRSETPEEMAARLKPLQHRLNMLRRTTVYPGALAPANPGSVGDSFKSKPPPVTKLGPPPVMPPPKAARTPTRITTSTVKPRKAPAGGTTVRASF